MIAGQSRIAVCVPRSYRVTELRRMLTSSFQAAPVNVAATKQPNPDTA